MNMNFQSLSSKFDDIKLLLNSFEQYEKHIQVLCLQETWIGDVDFLDLSLFQIQYYNLITQNRYASAHVGLTYYIHKKWAYTIRTCENNLQYWEEMFITLTDHVETKQNKFSIGTFYRPPHTQVSQLTSFLDYFSTPTTTLMKTFIVVASLNVFLALDTYHLLLYPLGFLIIVPLLIILFIISRDI